MFVIVTTLWIYILCLLNGYNFFSVYDESQMIENMYTVQSSHEEGEATVAVSQNILEYSLRSTDLNNGTCKAFPTIISLVPKNSPPDSFFSPSFVEVSRCGGYCHGGSGCNPVGATLQKVTVQEWKIGYDDWKDSLLIGTHLFEIEVHLYKCECQCPFTENDCELTEKFSKEYCKCYHCSITDSSIMETCQVNEDTWNDRHWNPVQCLCQCDFVQECVNSAFDYDHCRCKEDVTEGNKTEPLTIMVNKTQDHCLPWDCIPEPKP